jgi:hypothetical protein
MTSFNQSAYCGTYKNLHMSSSAMCFACCRSQCAVRLWNAAAVSGIYDCPPRFVVAVCCTVLCGAGGGTWSAWQRIGWWGPSFQPAWVGPSYPQHLMPGGCFLQWRQHPPGVQQWGRGSCLRAPGSCWCRDTQRRRSRYCHSDSLETLSGGGGGLLQVDNFQQKEGPWAICDRSSSNVGRPCSDSAGMVPIVLLQMVAG